MLVDDQEFLTRGDEGVAEFAEVLQTCGVSKAGAEAFKDWTKIRGTGAIVLVLVPLTGGGTAPFLPLVYGIEIKERKDALRAILATAPIPTSLWENRALARARKASADDASDWDAINLLRRKLKRSPRSVVLLFELGRSYEREDELELALDAYRSGAEAADGAVRLELVNRRQQVEGAIDDRAYAQALGRGQRSDLVEYCKLFPGGRHLAEANRQIRAIDRADAFASASRDGTRAALREFCTTFPEQSPERLQAERLLYDTYSREGESGFDAYVRENDPRRDTILIPFLDSAYRRLFGRIDRTKPESLESFAARYPRATVLGEVWSDHYRLIAQGGSEDRLAAYLGRWPESTARPDVYEEIFLRYYKAAGAEGELAYLQRYPDSTMRAEIEAMRDRRRYETRRCLLGVAVNQVCGAFKDWVADSLMDDTAMRALSKGVGSGLCEGVAGEVAGRPASSKEIAISSVTTVLAEHPSIRSISMEYRGERILVREAVTGLELYMTLEQVRGCAR